MVIDPTRPASSQVFGLLRAAIVQLDLKPGQALSENELAKAFSVSRQPVREAFIRLREAALVEIFPQRGTFVARISVERVMTARFVREAVEVALASEAAEKVADVDLDILAGLIVEQRKVAKADDAVRFLDLDEAFHRAIADIAEQPYAWTILEDIKAQMDRVRYLSFSGATPLDRLVDQHELIVECLRARDPDRASAAMRGHLREILKSLPVIASEHREFFRPADDAARSERLLDQARPNWLRDWSDNKTTGRKSR
jgi:DNA-binding GntR family transcriptional regulator